MVDGKQRRPAPEDAVAEGMGENGGEGPHAEGEDAAAANGPDATDVTGVDQAVADAFAEELAQARRTADENWERYLRAEADLENLRRRGEKRRQEAVDRGRRDLLARFLEVVDNLERALAHADADPSGLAGGVEGTYRDLMRLLTREGVAPIDAMDAPFDPALHEATGVVPMPGVTEERVVTVERGGYTINGDLLRPARVIVGQPVEPVEAEGRDDGD